MTVVLPRSQQAKEPTTLRILPDIADHEGFCLLARLLAHRELGVGEVAATAALPESELAAVVDGAEPSAALLRGLAPALGMHDGRAT
ncbi:hypothetical protein AB0C21_38565 [Spirillospora sp. NPDC049024]